MSFDLFLNFDGNCRQAVEFYAKVFQSEVEGLMTFSQAPSGYPIDEKEKDFIMYACVPIFGCKVMFCDIPMSDHLIKGNNISPTLGSKDAEQLTRIYHALAEEGKVGMELQSTFWSDLYGMVTDKFGITWQLSLDSGKN